MRNFVQVSLLLLSVSFSTLLPAASATTQLDHGSYEAFIKSGKNGMIKFYQEWCGHCKSMKPDWDQLAKHHASNPHVEIYDVDCGKEEQLCSENGVTGYPTIKYYVNGEEQPYQNGRSFEALDGFVTNVLSPKCTITSPDGKGTSMENCSDKEAKYFDKWIYQKKSSVEQLAKEKARLEEMEKKEKESANMAPELRRWMQQRIAILDQGVDYLKKKADSGEEL